MFKYNNLIIYRLIILVTYLVTVYTNLLDRNVPFWYNYTYIFDAVLGCQCRKQSSPPFIIKYRVPCWILSAIWHGAAWTFIIWGLLHAVGTMATRELEGKAWYHDRVPIALKRLFVFLFVSFAWIFFRSTGFDNALEVISGIGKLENFTFGSIVNKFWFVKGVSLTFYIL